MSPGWRGGRSFIDVELDAPAGRIARLAGARRQTPRAEPSLGRRSHRPAHPTHPLPRPRASSLDLGPAPARRRERPGAIDAAPGVRKKWPRWRSERPRGPSRTKRSAASSEPPSLRGRAGAPSPAVAACSTRSRRSRSRAGAHGEAPGRRASTPDAGLGGHPLNLDQQGHRRRLASGRDGDGRRLGRARAAGNRAPAAARDHRRFDGASARARVLEGKGQLQFIARVGLCEHEAPPIPRRTVQALLP